MKSLGLSDRRTAAITGLNRATVARLWLEAGSVEEIMARLLKRYLLARLAAIRRKRKASEEAR